VVAPPTPPLHVQTTVLLTQLDTLSMQISIQLRCHWWLFAALGNT